MNDQRARQADSAALLERLTAILSVAKADHVGADDKALWFDSVAAGGVHVRLSAHVGGRSYDRSANLAISYSGELGGEARAAAFQSLVERIKAIDHAPIEAAARVFAAAVERLVAGLEPSEPAVGSVPGHRLPEPPPIGTPSARLARQNVVFLDLCSRLVGRHELTFSPLHWGYWPLDAVVKEPYDPFAAFSENLLAHVPREVRRVMDVGCGLGVNAQLLAGRGKQVTAVSPVAHHCELIAEAAVPGIEVRCARFEDLTPDASYDLLLFSESLNHFAFTAEFWRHTKQFLVPSGWVLMADDLTAERQAIVETQTEFRLLRSIDITANVAPTTQWWERQMPIVAAYHAALMSLLEIDDPALAARVQAVLGAVENNELKVLLSGQRIAPAPQGRYMIYLLQRD